MARRLDGDREPERVYERLCGDAREAFWLDSSRVGEGARFSFLGAPGPYGARVTYDLGAGEVLVRRPGGEERRRESIFDYLASELERLRGARRPALELPFEFDCGFVGYLGYELKAECGGLAAHDSRHPDAGFILADRLVACDHEDGRTYLLCLVPDGAGAAGERWLEETEAALAELPASRGEPAPAEAGSEPLEFRLARSPRRHLEDVAAVKRELRAGESYEVCLTNRILATTAAGPLAAYRVLRRVNPAPHAALLRFGPGLSILSSSPERFLRIRAGGEVEAKPIKGTSARDPDPRIDARRAADLRADPKNRAENLMIVDLMRNDLGRVSEIGSVAVPRLMEVESFETVHQLVSTVTAKLRGDVGALECVRACFPPGSMTGAPKERTMAIIDRLEEAPRGPYSGAIGYFGTSGGCELSVAIRTIVLDDRGRAEIGVGGAIVMASDPEAELEEALLKGWAPMRALDASLPPAYSRTKLSASIPRVTPRKSTTSAAASTSAG